MIEFHQDERSFWRDLNPARFHLLARAYIDYKAPPENPPEPAPPGLESLRADGKWGNLLEDLGGG